MSKQQRRKGNAKNASSASAHGYLAHGGSALVGLTPEMNIFEVASNNQLHHVSGIDDETRIVMKKLTKKDCQTREKGLKELMELIKTENTSTESCYEHFTGLVSQLSTDGSPTVRMLTMKVIAMFLVKLKKAATKGLKKIIPMVLFAKSDVTNGVSASAAAVIRDGFDADKKLQIIQLFGPSTFEIATNIVLQKSSLSAPIEYDSSEDSYTRKSRLETQSLNIFHSYIKEFGSESIIWEEYARKVFDNSEYIKNVFTGNKESVKVQLLHLCYKFQDNVDVIMSVPQVIPYIQNTLDSQTFTPECAAAWEGLILLLPNENFQSKVSLQKGIYPRLLNVIRKKGNHWRVMKNYFLPVIIILLRELKAPENDSKIVASLLESFIDKLPWQIESSTQAINCWFYLFSEFVRWIFSNDTLNLNVPEVFLPIMSEMVEQAMLFSTAESTECISELLHWIVENKKLQKSVMEELSKQIQKKTFEVGNERSRLFKEAMTASGKHVEFSELHAIFLSNPDAVDFGIIKNLAHAEQNYFDVTLKKLNNFSFIENTDKFDMLHSGDVVHLIIRMIKSEAVNIPKITVKNNFVGRRLLLANDTDVWEKLLIGCPAELFQDMINYWHEKRNGTAIADVVSFLKSKGIILDTNQAAKNVDFLISLLHKLDTNGASALEEKRYLVHKLFAALFDSEEAPCQDHLDTMKKYLTIDFDSENYFDLLFSNNEENDTERVLDIASRFDKLMELCESQSSHQIAQSMLISEDKYDHIREQLRFLELDVLTFSHTSTKIYDAFTKPIKHLEEHEAVNIIKEFSRMALFNVASSYHSPLHQVFGWHMIRVIHSLSERYCLKKLDNELSNLRDELKKRVIRSEKVQKTIIDSGSSNFLVDIYELSSKDQFLLHYSAIGKSQEMEPRVNEIYSKMGTPLEYMEKAFAESQSDNAIPLFQFDQSNNHHWLSNLIFAKQFLQCGEKIFDAENVELRDFSLCGIVSVLDNCADVLADSPHAFEINPRLEALVSIYMELCLVLTKSVQKGNQAEQTVEEWNEFYAPTISTYFIRMFRAVRKDHQPTPFIRVLLKVLLSLHVFPIGAPNEDAASREFVPELSVFKYSTFEESCISHAFSLFSSKVEHVQLIGYAVSKILIPVMFRTENEKALIDQHDVELNITSRPKLSLPVMIAKSYPQDHSHPHVGPLLLDLSLIPLQSPDIKLSQVQRVEYCDVIDHFFKNALNSLMLDQPFEFRQIPIVCRIPKLREREYYLCSDKTPSPVFFEKFSARLLFKSMTLLPAAVRLFYKGMPNCFMPMFQEAVTKYASKLLIEQELEKVSQATFEGEMKVRTVPVTGEIIAEYVIEETKMKLTIELPSDYPLSVPTMKLDKAIVKNDRAKKWLLQLNAYLFHQNGAILEGIEMWKRNVDKGVEGAEDCTICMMTVHQQTHQLPKIRCKQCKNKFHSNCLYKWFESSNQSTCPLCRNNFT